MKQKLNSAYGQILTLLVWTFIREFVFYITLWVRGWHFWYFNYPRNFSDRANDSYATLRSWSCGWRWSPLLEVRDHLPSIPDLRMWLICELFDDLFVWSFSAPGHRSLFRCEFSPLPPQWLEMITTLVVMVVECQQCMAWMVKPLAQWSVVWHKCTRVQ